MRPASWRGMLLAASLALAALGCGNNPVTPTGVARAALTITSSPSPIVAVQRSPVGPTFFLMWTVNIQETAGQGGEVQEVKASLFDDVTGVLVSVVSFDSDDLTVFVGEKRIEANGSLEVPQQLSYVLPDGRRTANLTITVRFRDDRGNTFDQAVLVKVV